MTRIIVLASGKGGVGKTTLTINLAAALTWLGEDTLIIDANLTTPNIALQLGMPTPNKTLHSVLRGESDIKEVVYFHPPSGLKVIPAGLSLKDLKSHYAKKLEKVILDLIGAVDNIIIDSPAGLTDITRRAIEAGDELLVLTIPEMPALTDALKTVEIAKEAGTKIIGVVVNRVKNVKEELHPRDIEQFLEVPVFGVIPEDKNMQKALRKNVPLLLSYPHSDASIAIKKIAAKLVGKEYDIIESPVGVRRRLRKFLRKVLRRK
ncbi:MAG: P-loop NTPase [Nanoarchaeota archaeon]|nr:P-loop NTPase [Nanoarchaeota archaeon]